MQIHHLKYILKVAELGSITKAANELYISQPSLTKVISNIENKYNLTIFNRTPTGVTVSLEGNRFLHYVKNIVTCAASLDETFKNHSYLDKVQLLIATQELDFIPQVFLNMYNKYSNDALEFELYKSHRSNVITAIQKRDCNIGLFIQTNKEAKAFDWQLKSTNLEIELLDSSGVYALLGPKSNLYDSKSLSFEDVKGLSHICLDVDEITRSEWKAHPRHLNINNNSIIHCNSISLCIELLEKTDMILCAPKWIFKYFANTNIKILPINNNTYLYHLIYIKRKNEPLTPIEMQFIEEVKRSLAYNPTF